MCEGRAAERIRMTTLIPSPITKVRFQRVTTPGVGGAEPSYIGIGIGLGVAIGFGLGVPGVGGSSLLAWWHRLLFRCVRFCV